MTIDEDSFNASLLRAAHSASSLAQLATRHVLGQSAGDEGGLVRELQKRANEINEAIARARLLARREGGQ